MSSTVKGEAKWDTCWRQACYLSKYIYKDPNLGFTTLYPEKMTEVEQNWEVWDNKEVVDDSGLVARLFKLKDWDPNMECAVCPPCLVFRGTDFDDMRGLAIAAVVRLFILGTSWEVFTKTIVFDDTMPKQKEVWKSGQNYPDLVDYSREELEAMGFTAIPIYQERDRATVEGATDGTHLTIDVEVQLDVMAKQDGDWVSNLRQGLGQGSPQ